MKSKEIGQSDLYFMPSHNLATMQMDDFLTIKLRSWAEEELSSLKVRQTVYTVSPP